MLLKRAAVVLPKYAASHSCKDIQDHSKLLKANHPLAPWSHGEYGVPLKARLRCC